MRRTRNKVVWKSPAELPPEVAATPRLRPFRFPFNGEPTLPGWMTRPIQPGDGFLLKMALNRVSVEPGMEAPPHPYLVPGLWNGPVAAAAMAVYMGPLRIADRGGSTVHLRHTFLIGGEVFVVFDIDNLLPLEPSAWTPE